MKTVQIPDFVDYPELLDVTDNLSLFNGMLCYIINPYKVEGVNVYIGFREDCVLIRMADFNSKEISVSNEKDKVNLIMPMVEKIVEIMKHSRIVEASYYFSLDPDPVLVDMMISANKFAGPGMLRDLFGNSMKTQEVIAIEKIDEEVIANNKFNVLKPSRFRYLLDGGVIKPHYGVIK